MTRERLLIQMEQAMDRYDLSEAIKGASIGEYIYGVAMVPCDWVYPYVKGKETASSGLEREKIVTWLKKETHNAESVDNDYIDCVPVETVKAIIEFLT